jgi:DNA-binding Xre family transcriptional regulator
VLSLYIGGRGWTARERVTMKVRFCLQELLDSHDPPMSQSELARRSGITLVTINGIANNRTAMVSLKTLGAIASALGVQPGDLLVGGTRSRKA